MNPQPLPPRATLVSRTRSPRLGWWTGLVLVFALSLAQLMASGMSAGELLIRGLLLGLVLPMLAWVACLGVPVASEPAPWQRSEAWAIALLLSLVVLGLGPLKQGLLAYFPSRGTWWGEAANTGYKLLLFVVLPWLVLKACGLWKAAGEARVTPVQWLRILLLVSLLGWGLQTLMGREFQRVLDSDMTPARWWLAVPLVWLWMSVEAGLVEELFFRRWLQSRLQAWSGSAWLAVVLSAVVFGLAHAPGLWMRGAGLGESLPAHPSLIECMAYAVTTQGLAGLMFGVLWLRTRSLSLCVLAHGMFDVPAHLARHLAIWGI